MLQVDGLDTLETEEDLWLLDYYARLIEPPNCYLEIGVAEGGSALTAIKAVRQMVPVYGVDTSVPKLKHPRFRLLLGTAREWGKIFKEPIGVLFIDCVPAEIGQDIEEYGKLVVPGGYALIHDGTCGEIIINTTGWTVVRRPWDTVESAMYILQKDYAPSN